MRKELTKNVANNVSNTNSQHLTEQYFNVTLKTGTYYVLDRDGNIEIDYYGGDNFQWSVVKKILAPVPTYDQFVELTEKVERLEQLLESETLAKQEGVEIVAELEQQLNEANEVIKKYRRFEVALKVEKGILTGVYPAVAYLKKWCVK